MHKFLIADVFDTFCLIATKLFMVRGRANDIYSPNLVNFYSGVLRCHAATCISSSKMHLFIVITTSTQYRHEIIDLFLLLWVLLAIENMKITVRFLQISQKTQLLSCNEVYFQKAERIRISLMYCRNRNLVNFSHTNQICFWRACVTLMYCRCG